MSDILSGVASKITEKTIDGIDNTINSAKNTIRQAILGDKLINPFDIYEFTVKLYWLLCFKLNFDNTFITESEYYSNIVTENLLESLYSNETTTNNTDVDGNNESSLPENVNNFLNENNDILDINLLSQIKSELVENPLFIKKIVANIFENKETFFEKKKVKKYLKQTDVEYAEFVNNSMPKQWTYSEWFVFVNTWNNNNCDLKDFNDTKADADRMVNLQTTYATLSTVPTKIGNSGISYSIPAPEPDTSTPGEKIKLTKIPLVFQKDCEILNDESTIKCGEYNIQQNFMNFNLIKDDLVRILYIVIRRILYGDFDNCYFDWYNDQSAPRAYRTDLSGTDGSSSKWMLDNLDFILDNLIKFNSYLTYLININTPGILGIIKLHTRSLNDNYGDNDYEFLKNLDENNKKWTMKGTLETSKILNSNLYNKYIKEKINSSSQCTKKVREQSSEKYGVPNLYLASLAWKILYNLKRTLLFLYEYSLILSKVDLTKKINDTDLKNNYKSVKYFTHKTGGSDSRAALQKPNPNLFLLDYDDSNPDWENQFESLYIPSVNVTKIAESIKNLKSDLWAGRFKNNEGIDPNKNILQTEYLSVIYRGVCNDLTEDEARRLNDELENSSESDSLDDLLDDKTNEIHDIIDNLIYKGGITTKNINKETVTNNIRNIFTDFTKKSSSVFKSLLKFFDGREKVLKKYQEETITLLNGNNIENLYQVINWGIDSLLSNNYLKFFNLINILANYKFSRSEPQNYSDENTYIKDYSIINNYTIYSIQPKDFLKNNPLLSKYIIIGNIYCPQNSLSQNAKLGTFPRKCRVILLKISAINEIENSLYSQNLDKLIIKTFNESQNNNLQNKYVIDTQYQYLENNNSGEEVSINEFTKFMMNILNYYMYQKDYVFQNNKCNTIGIILNNIISQLDSSPLIYNKCLISGMESDSNLSTKIPIYTQECNDPNNSIYYTNSSFNTQIDKKSRTLYIGDEIKPLHYYEDNNPSKVNSPHIPYLKGGYPGTARLPGPDNVTNNITGVKDINGFIKINRVDCKLPESEIKKTFFELKSKNVLPYYCLLLDKIYSGVQYKINKDKLLKLISDKLSELIKKPNSEILQNQPDVKGGNKKTKKKYRGGADSDNIAGMKNSHLEIIINNVINGFGNTEFNIGNDMIAYEINDKPDNLYSKEDISKFMIIPESISDKLSNIKKDKHIISDILDDIINIIHKKIKEDTVVREEITKKTDEEVRIKQKLEREKFLLERFKKDKEFLEKYTWPINTDQVPNALKRYYYSILNKSRSTRICEEEFKEHGDSIYNNGLSKKDFMNLLSKMSGKTEVNYLLNSQIQNDYPDIYDQWSEFMKFIGYPVAKAKLTPVKTKYNNDGGFRIKNTKKKQYKLKKKSVKKIIRLKKI